MEQWLPELAAALASKDAAEAAAAAAAADAKAADERARLVVKTVLVGLKVDCHRSGAEHAVAVKHAADADAAFADALRLASDAAADAAAELQLARSSEAAALAALREKERATAERAAAAAAAVVAASEEAAAVVERKRKRDGDVVELEKSAQVARGRYLAALQMLPVENRGADDDTDDGHSTDTGLAG